MAVFFAWTMSSCLLASSATNADYFLSSGMGPLLDVDTFALRTASYLRGRDEELDGNAVWAIVCLVVMSLFLAMAWGIAITCLYAANREYKIYKAGANAEGANQKK
ncbi:unnamed protein product [Cyprideis torosa]|uniref:Uncharacterized protein n=1 Tax=Cyprideis torosa TaxID=163714 RepID=A0A7R8WJF4_9CRUS|nr:unnamed protein product [Cyprideis torosa]CAG0895594.1 unnamed protein product [Cyprideis torosa]